MCLGLQSLIHLTDSEWQDSILSIAVRAAPAGIPTKYSRLMTVSYYLMETEVGHLDVSFCLSCCIVIFLDGKNSRNEGMCCHPLRYCLPLLSVHGCAHLWLLLIDATAHHSLHTFFKYFSIICDSSPLDAGNQREQDSWSFYSQATLSLVKEQIFNKYSEIVYLESVKM